MWKLSIFKRKRRGFALVFTILIALAMIIPVMILASSAITRRRSVSGEAISDRVLTVADATVDRILSKINKFPDLSANDPTIKDGLDKIGIYYTNNPPTDPFEVKNVAVKYVMGYLLSTLNGGTIYQPDGTSDPASNLQADETQYPGIENVNAHSIWDIEDNITTYLYNLDTQEYFMVVTDSGEPLPISITGINGDIVTKHIKNLSNGDIKLGIASWDQNYLTDNRWVEIDTNTEYTDDGSNQPGSTKFQIRVSAYPISKSMNQHIVRNILAEATLETINANISSSNGSTTGGSSTNVGPFHYAVWSGKGFTLNGVHTIQSGHRDSDGNIVYDGKNGSGDIYADGQIIINGNNRIYGNIATSGAEEDNAIIANGNLKMGNNHKLIYGHKETLPDFSAGTEQDVKTTAQNTGTIHPGDFDYNNSYSTLNVNGGEVAYYIGGNTSIMGWDNTIKFYPRDNVNSDGPKVDWYIDGDLTIIGDVTLDFGNTPGIVWVNGNVIFNGSVTIIGSGTIVANKRITLNGYSDISSTTPNAKIAFISEGVDSNGGIILNGNNTVSGIFYAPHSDIILNGTGDVFGSLVAGGYISSMSAGVIVNGNQNITYDTGIESGGNDGTNPPLPTGGGVTVDGVSFSASAVYRLSWREIISDPVTPSNIQKLSPEFNFKDPSS
ncbi:MAG: hypothetical protein J7L03_04020 [Caldisericaceae bacterium]|nr:hypothetical protein [Caldisericaceae bacterium]